MPRRIRTQLHGTKQLESTEVAVWDAASRYVEMVKNQPRKRDISRRTRRYKARLTSESAASIRMPQTGCRELVVVFCFTPLIAYALRGESFFGVWILEIPDRSKVMSKRAYLNMLRGMSTAPFKTVLRLTSRIPAIYVGIRHLTSPKETQVSLHITFNTRRESIQPPPLLPKEINYTHQLIHPASPTNSALPTSGPRHFRSSSTTVCATKYPCNAGLPSPPCCPELS